MRLDDHLMTILTGLVLAILVGIMAQKSDYILDAFSGERAAIAEPDSFIVRAGHTQDLDVLINDLGGKAAHVKVMSNPSCGAIDAVAGKLRYSGSEGCSGLVSFSYCLSNSKDCAPAKVVLNVRPDKTQMAKASASTDPEQDVIRAFVVSTDAPAQSFDDALGALTTQSVSKYLVDTQTGALDGLAQNAGNVSVVPTGPSPLDPKRTAEFLFNGIPDAIQSVRHAASRSSN